MALGRYTTDYMQPPTPDPQAPLSDIQSPAATEPLNYPDMAAVTQLAKDPSAPTGPTSGTDSGGDSPTKWIKTILLGLVNWIVIPVAIVFILHNFVFQAFHVIGTSMVPTLHDTDYLIVSKVGASESEISRGFNHSSTYIPKRDEIIVFHYPKDPTLVFIKRVIALPGERVTVENGVVTVYNKTHPNGFNPDAGTVRTQYPTLGSIDEVVPAGNVFVLGDNRTPNGSYDSRDWGFLPSSYIIGDAVLRLLPVGNAGVL